MKYINRDEFEQMLEISKSKSYRHVNFPEPCKKIKRTRGRSIPVWSVDVADAYVKSKLKFDYNTVKKLNDSGLNRGKMAEKLGITVKKLNAFCQHNKIISLQTVKSNKARYHELKVQGELWRELPKRDPLYRFLHRHVMATSSLRG